MTFVIANQDHAKSHLDEGLYREVKCKITFFCNFTYLICKICKIKKNICLQVQRSDS